MQMFFNAPATITPNIVIFLTNIHSDLSLVRNNLLFILLDVVEKTNNKTKSVKQLTITQVRNKFLKDIQFYFVDLIIN